MSNRLYSNEKEDWPSARVAGFYGLFLWSIIMMAVGYVFHLKWCLKGGLILITTLAIMLIAYKLTDIFCKMLSNYFDNYDQQKGTKK